MASLFRRHKTGKEDKTGKGNKTGKDNVAKPERPAPDKTSPAPLLDDDDERFLERLVSRDDDDEGPPPPLPPRPRTPDLTWDTDSESVQLPKTTTAQAAKKQNRLTRLFHRKPPQAAPGGPADVTPQEADREWADLNRVLARLGIEPGAPDAADQPAGGGKAKARAAAMTASAEVQSLMRQFVVVLRDIMHGAPTAVDDLVALLDGRNDVLRRGFDRLPESLQKLVTQLPRKLTSSLGPDVLAAAAEAHGGKRAPADADAGGLARFLVPRSLGDLVLTPAIVKSMLKAIVNALKLRWPAFVGTSMLWSTAVFLLLFVLWYCHKRGKEEREKLEAAEKEREAAGGEGGGQTGNRSPAEDAPSSA